MADTKVLVVGGGVAGCTAAYWIARQPGFQVTLTTMGWKLGGKGSSGRNPVESATPQWRSEEHGPHIWTGGYYNSFRTCQHVYDEFLTKFPSHGPFQHLLEGPTSGPNPIFRRASEAEYFPEPTSADETPWVMNFPSDPTKADGDPTEPAPTILDSLERIYLLLRKNLSLLPKLPARVALPASKLALDSTAPLTEFSLGLDKLLHELAERRINRSGSPTLSIPIIESLQFLNSLALLVHKGDHHRLRMPLFFDYLLALSHAICAELWRDGKSFDDLNGQDYQSLLRDHGALKPTVHDSAFVRSFYDSIFAYPNGTDSSASVEAGTALRTAVWIFFGFRGAYLYKMQAGMGEVVFSPLYETTRTIIDYRFFHELEEINLSDDGRVVENLVFREQLRLRDAAHPYDPLIKVPSADDMLCWPHEPRWDQLHPEDVAHVTDPRDLERPGRFADQPKVTLDHGTDFDLVVFALPPAVLARLGGNLLGKKPALRTMANGLPSVATANFQAWVTGQSTDRPLWHDRLGISEPLLASAGPGEFDVLMDYSPVLKTEHHPALVCHLLYECGTIPDSESRDPYQVALDWLNAHGGAAFPSLANPSGSFDLNRLFTLSSSTNPAIRQQYARFNLEGSERYILSAVGTWPHRPTAGQSGVDNLFFAGDWTRTGIDLGCVESAVTSGMLAAELVSGANLDIRLPLSEF